MRGVLVGGNNRQEWLLPWWWKNFRRYNQDPVAFVDFGLSEDMKTWCKERGELIPLRMPPLFVKDREEVDPALTEVWESRFPDAFWTSREAWFKKAQACLQSPFQKTIWLDLDCEVVGSLEELWNICDDPSGIALARDSVALASQYPIYNSGVIAFHNKHRLIVEWALQSIENNGRFRSDQDLLSHIIAEKGFTICELSPIYNWSVGNQEREDVVIYHWLGDAAKSVLQNKLILEELG